MTCHVYAWECLWPASNPHSQTINSLVIFTYEFVVAVVGRGNVLLESCGCVGRGIVSLESCGCVGGGNVSFES